MGTSRWLLPFTYGVDTRAIDLAVDLAERAGAVLVPVSLISVPSERRLRGARLEHIQQSKDFLEAVRWKADRYHVAIERHEIFTADVMQSIRLLVADLRCDAIMLVTTGDREVLLQANELKRLLESPAAPLLIIRMSIPPENAQPRTGIGRFLSRLRHLWEAGKQQSHEGEEPLWIRMERCPLQ